MRVYPLVILIALTMLGCAKDDPVENLPPETSIWVSSINLSGEDRLQSQVRLFWNGNDQDGFVEYYEISLDGISWSKTFSTDSVFNFALSTGQDSVDKVFHVRAVDNENTPDPEPARLTIPIKNTPPETHFNTSLFVEDTAFFLFSALWETNDVDGNETIDSFYLKANDGPWITIHPDISFLTIIPEKPKETGIQNAKLFANTSFEQLAITLPGLNVGGNNLLYLKSKDIAGAYSAVDTSAAFVLAHQKGDVWVIDASSSQPAPSKVLLPIIRQYAGEFSYVNMASQLGKNLPTIWNPTFSAKLNLFDQVYFFTDRNLIDGKLVLELASESLQKYINSNGKLFVSGRFPRDLEKESPVFSFSPMDSFTSSRGQARIANDAKALPDQNTDMNLSTLVCNAFITGATPFYPKAGAEVIYRVELLKTGGWEGPDVIGAKTKNRSLNTNQVIFSVEIDQFNKDQAALEQLFQEIVLKEFKW